MKRFSVSIAEDLIQELDYKPETFEFDTIKEAVEFEGYTVHRDNYYITEWDYDDLDAYGIPEIIQTVSMVELDGTEDELPTW
jgi:hypothetical protein